MPDLGSPPVQFGIPNYLGSPLHFGIPQCRFGIPPKIWVPPMQVLGSLPFQTTCPGFWVPPSADFGIPSFFGGFQTVPRISPSADFGIPPILGSRRSIQCLKFFACGAKLHCINSLCTKKKFACGAKLRCITSLYP